ncbi:hypothetical protein PENTCL1PPCAC_28980, partial [Pristionchus entomophagus]
MSLKTHLNLHIDDENAKRPYKCNHCGRRFTQSSGLRYHEKTHLPLGDPRKGDLNCEICGKLCCSSKALDYHKLKHLDDEEARLPYKCEECGYRC